MADCVGKACSMIDSRKPWLSLITPERVVALHARGIREHSQAPLSSEQLSDECVDGKLGNAWTSEQYRFEDENVKQGLCFAGYALFYLARSGCFVDGNKRVAWATATAVLGGLGLTVIASDEDVIDFVLGIADGRIQDGIEVARWLGLRLAAPDPDGPIV